MCRDFSVLRGLGSRYVGCLFCSLSPCPGSSAPVRRQSKGLAVGCSDGGVRQLDCRTDELRDNKIYLHSNKLYPASSMKHIFSRAVSQVAFASVYITIIFGTKFMDGKFLSGLTFAYAVLNKIR